MSQGKNKTGWELPSYIDFRKGQQKLYEVIKANPNKTRYAVKLPTGYGKSWCACIAYATLRGLGNVDRLLLIVPTDTQRSQYISGLREDLMKMGIDYRGIEKCDTQQSWVIKKSFRNESEIFVTTVQSISANPSWFADLMSKNNWLTVADEFHHYGEDNTWGEAIKQLPTKTVLGMSATPFRGDKSKTIFGDVPFDVEVTIEDAIKEGALRGIEVHECDYDVTFTTEDDKNPQTVLMSKLPELASELDCNVSEWEIKRQVRFHTKYVHSILLQAINAWMNYESRYPKQNQILVFAMTCKHAESIAAAINDIAFPGLPEPFADWVGTGSWEDENGIPYGRTREQNVAIIERFQSNQLPCLVQVNLAGEGFNNKRCSIGVMLDLIGDTPMKRQHVGRFIRVNPQSPNNLAVIFASSDAPCLPLLKSIEEQTAVEPLNKEKTERGEINRQDFLQLEIPDLIVLDTQLQTVTKSYPYGTLEKTVQAFKEQSPELKASSDEVIVQAVEAFMTKMMGQHTQLSSEDRRNQVASQVKQAMGRIVNHILYLRFGKSFPKSAKGDLHKKIHGYYIRLSGRQSDLTEEELRTKHEWLKELAESIKDGGIPAWLSI